MRKGMTISGAGLAGMLAVSWISIVLIGGAWMLSMYREFQDDSVKLREEYYENRRNLVRNEVEKAYELVATLRRTGLESLRREVEARSSAFRALADVLRQGVAQNTAAPIVRTTVMKLLAAQDADKRLYTLRDNTIFLFSPFPGSLDKDDVMDQVEAALKGIAFGRRELPLRVPTGMSSSTLLLSVREFDNPHLRVISGACLEMAEEKVKQEVLRRLETIRYGEGNFLFGGTFQGVSILGPAKGQNMWEVMDRNGVKIVQELVHAAQRGGDFVSYIMPAIDGQRNATKVSYVRSIPDWQWYVGAGAWVDEIEGVIKQNREELKERLLRRGTFILAGLVLLSIMASYISFRLSRNIRHNLASFTGVWDNAVSGRGEIDTSVLHYDEFKELAAAANRMAADRQAAQGALADSVQRFSMLVSNIPGIVYRCENGPNWVNTFVSDSALDITGYSPEEFLEEGGRTFHSIIYSEDQGWVNKVVNEDLKHRRTYSVDYRIIRKDGEIRWLAERGRGVWDSLGEPIRLDGVIFDVTDKKQAEEEYYSHVHFLETMERIDRALHEPADADNMLFSTMEAVRHAFGADRARLLFPCDPEAPAYRVIVERSIPEYPNAKASDADIPMDAAVQDVFRAVLASPVPLVFDSATSQAIAPEMGNVFDGQSQLVFAISPRVGKPWLLALYQYRKTRVWNKDESRLFMEVGRRLSEGLSSSLILAELRESEERFRTLSEQTLLGLCVLQDDRIIFSNQSFADVLETTVPDLKSLSAGEFSKYVHPDDRDFLMEQARRKQLGASDVVASYTWRVLTETGRIKWVEIHSKTTKVGGRLADLVSLVDITALKRTGEGLEAIIAERTRDLALKAEELKRANTELKKLDQLKSAFLTTVSHAMRTPLTSVLGYASLVCKDLDKLMSKSETSDDCLERAGRNLDIMASEGQRLYLLIDQFLELTDLEARTDLRTENVYPVEDVIRRTVDAVRARSENDLGVELVLELDGPLPELNVPPVYWEKLLVRFLENAYSFTRKGRIIVYAGSPDGVGVELSVSDTGKGIPEEELESIFKPFHQVETGDTLVDEIKGAGLGLAVCRMIVERLHGTIRVESTPSKGTTFFVFIPGQTPL